MIDIRFDGLEKLIKQLDPAIIEKAQRSAIRKIGDQAATQVSRKIRQHYPVSATQMRDILKKGTFQHRGTSARILRYSGERLSLRHFSTTSKDAYGSPKKVARPRVKSRRGTRYGARTRDQKKKPRRIVNRGFWGRGRNNGIHQIFQRSVEDDPQSSLVKLTGPSIPHMVRNTDVIAVFEAYVGANLGRVFQHELDHFMKKARGTR